MGIPYATPPVNANRLSPTRAPTKWRGVLTAVAHPPACPQRPPKKYQRLFQHQSEDCLYLNIYVPGEWPLPQHLRARNVAWAALLPTRDGAATSPVLVLLHGESFEWGSGSAYDGSLLATLGDLIVVTLNFRLGILGFLNPHAEPHRPAVTNNGLMDQLAALHWLHENIASFGGDPAHVRQTLCGVS
ncbi:hypothetical protein HAZT_HAZT002341 [Hyalella azteca]|uniref:Carboxylesterase type B domain-containing protein n=1 Tax=Hyalella azteca TaxID=294128 RepID=A0A6A0H7G2_HYAAZ|nr:hypothetical protein HAZT_HAZT002341 [Hyalella azteca]